MGLLDPKDKDEEIENLKYVIRVQEKEIKRLEALCEEKDEFFTEMIADGLRHGSALAARHMKDRNEFLKAEN